MGARRLFTPLMVLLTGAAWLALLVWQQTPYGRYLDHGNWTNLGVASAVCWAVPAGDIVLPALIYAGGWLLMISAMMLPTALPLFRRFDRLAQSRPDHVWLLVLLITGYLLAWGGFGFAAHLLDTAIYANVRQSAWLLANSWVLGAVVLTIAGLFQFSRLKYRCLDQCRAPLGFIIKRWHGRGPWRSAFRLGLSHGLFCIGCCWALMLLMFVVGTANIGWMLVLGALMAIEKNAPWGRHVSQPLGVALIGVATLVTGMNMLG